MSLHRYVLLDASRLEETIGRAVKAAVEEILRGSSELQLYGAPEATEGRPVPRESDDSEEKMPAPPGLYRIGTAADEHSYADVVYERIDALEFSQADALRVLRRFVFGLSPRHRDSMRRSLDNDPRFKRLERKGVWWAKQDPNQLEID